jgi:hypothetical protein
MRHTYAVLALVLLAACSGDSSTNPAPSLVGTYNLSTVNGSPLPFVLPPLPYARQELEKIELLGEQFVVDSGNTFTEVANYRATRGNAVDTTTFSDAGTYSVSGTAATFHFNSGASTGTGTIGNRRFTVAQDGFSSLYVKQ